MTDRKAYTHSNTFYVYIQHRRHPIHIGLYTFIGDPYAAIEASTGKHSLSMYSDTWLSILYDVIKRSLNTSTQPTAIEYAHVYSLYSSIYAYI